MPNPAQSLAVDIATAARGFLMGAADIVPGVSGGTVALVLGVYQRLLVAITHFDLKLIALLLQGKFRSAADHIDLRFLVTLGGGIAMAIVTLAHLMHHLLEHQRGPTYAAFFGLILASGILVGRMCRPRSEVEAAACIVVSLVAGAGAYWVVSLGHGQGQPGLGYTFVSGMIGITAMILPGVSGSYLLLMLGKYHEITGIIKDVPRLAVSGDQLATLAVFAAGCVCGLLMFSHVLRWLLARFPAMTMATLCGFMIGSLRQVWPFAVDTTPGIEKIKHKIYEPIWPETFGRTEMLYMAIGIGTFVAVLIIDAVARQYDIAPDEQMEEERIA